MLSQIKPAKQPIYLDHAATTPVRAEVLAAMRPYWSTVFGNPSSLYKQGLQARQVVDAARKSVADVLSVRPEEIVFTAGGTESANLAILGVARAYRKTHKTGGHIITSQIEHHAVLRACQELEREGFAVTYIGVDNEGFFDLKELKQSIRKDTILVSLMYANNEIGTIEPIAEIGKLIKKLNIERHSLSTSASAKAMADKKHLPARRSLGEGGALSTPILFHSDACQAAGSLELNINKLGVDLLTLNASKIYGPKQVGCLYVRKGVQLEPLVYGGGQEKDLRSGTENVPGVIGFARALELAHKERLQEVKRLSVLRDYFIAQVLKKIPKATVNGPADVGVKRASSELNFGLRRLPNNINLQLQAEGEAVMLYLDAKNIATATGSACTTESADPSHVLKAIGLTDTEAKSSLRITLGKSTTKQQLDYVLKVLPEVVKLVANM